MSQVENVPIPGGWTRAAFDVADRTFELIVPGSPEAILDDLATRPKEQQEDDVFWCQVWKAAPPMARCVLSRFRQRGDWPTGTRCLELGCGLGLVGMAAAAAGFQATFSDYVDTAVQAAVENARRNGLTNVAGMTIDWRCPPSERYPAILGCDLLYFPHLHEPLLNTVESTLAPDGLCWLGDAGRAHTAEFIAAAARRGFAVGLFDETLTPCARPTQNVFQLVELRRSKTRDR